ncbi:NF-kappa-B essential modulator-like [Protopterus annectens]|uniref:NF-kappa-B essential modulator-like n=1 Tax=Protopterus annectens TaxID=7888 RepID=UPI001CFC3AD5|nr:NF-kappa-B essential modulator-like [Protopterus annectens]
MSVEQKSQATEMVQPAGSLGNDYDMINGGSSLSGRQSAAFQLPFEIASHEAVQHILRENQDLKEAIQQSNQALRGCYEELLGFRTRNKEEKDFLMQKFEEARNVVKKLNQEKVNLKSLLEESLSKIEVYRKSLQDSSSPGDSLTSCTITSSNVDGRLGAPLTDVTSDEKKVPDGGNELILLKNQKERLEDSLKELTLMNQKLLQERNNLEALNKELQSKTETTVAKPCTQIKENGVQTEVLLTRDMLQGAGNSTSGAKYEAEMQKKLSEQELKLQEMQERKKDLELLLENAQRDFAKLKLREKENEKRNDQNFQNMKATVEQLEKDKATLKAQITSLLAEVHESQNGLEICLKERSAVEERYHVVNEKLRLLEQDNEGLRKQQNIAMDQLRLQVQNLNSALKMERQNATEEKRKFAQLQAAYQQLFQDYDRHMKMEDQKPKGVDKEQFDELNEQLQQAEEALVAKQDLIDKLKEDAEHYKTLQETVTILKAQAEIFKADFLAEREAREKLHEQKESLQEQLQKLKFDFERVRTELDGAKRGRIEEMQQRHKENFHVGPVHYPIGTTIPFHAPIDVVQRRPLTEDQPDFRCPKCQYKAPDMDTLQIHVMDCIQ